MEKRAGLQAEYEKKLLVLSQSTRQHIEELNKHACYNEVVEMLDAHVDEARVRLKGLVG
jgi:hypothetical protein